MLLAQGNRAEALKLYQASVAIGERLAKLDPGNALWQLDVSIAGIKVGDAQRAQGHRAEALRLYQAALTIRERLAKADPGNTQWQADLALSLMRVAGVSAPSDERAALTRALAILEPLASAGRLTATQQRWPQIIRDRLAKLPP